MLDHIQAPPAFGNVDNDAPIQDYKLGIDQPLERAIIGLILENGKQLTRFPRLRPEHFYTPDYRYTWDIAQSLMIAGRAIDLMAVRAWAKAEEIKIDFVKLADATMIPDVRFVAKGDRSQIESLMIQNWQRRKIIDLFHQSDRTKIGVSELADLLAEITLVGGRGPEKIGPIAMRLLADAEMTWQSVQNNEAIPGSIYWSIPAADRLGGLRKNELIILAGRPGMGKSTLARWLAYHVAHQIPTLMLSREMSGEEIIGLMAGLKAQVPQNEIRKMSVSKDQYMSWVQAVGTIEKNLNLQISDIEPLGTMLSQIRAWRMGTDMSQPGLLILDYLQQVEVEGYPMKDARSIGKVSAALKQIAMELDICVVALAQLSRAVETRGGDKRPMLSDLRDSGEIEQDADQVVFAYRAEYYGFETDDEGRSTQGQIEMIHAKNRKGKPGTAMSYVRLDIGAFFEETLSFDTTQHQKEQKVKLPPNLGGDDWAPF